MPQPAISRKSAVSFVLAVLSLFLWAFTNVPALPVGIACLALAFLAIWDVRRSQGQLKGHGLAVGSIATEGAAMLVFLLLLPAIQRVREAADSMAST